MGTRELDTASLVAGLVVIALGAILLLDRTGTIDLRFGLLWPALTGAAGAVLLAVGLSARHRG